MSIKIGLASRFSSDVSACAALMIENDLNIGNLDLGMVVVRHDSPEYHERSKAAGCIFYSFEQGGVTFHVAFA